tara:strand:- start:2241 stop:2738 length:498 start_codon:yes stop_codon:yes gene_type:complete
MTPSGHCSKNSNPMAAATAPHQYTAPSTPGRGAWEPAHFGRRFHSQRAIIPASGFHEWTGEKGHKQCYNIHPVNSAIAFAGLYELWDFQVDIVPSFAIITLPPHPRFSHIHPKSIPLMLKPEDFDMWLDPNLTNTDPFQHLLKGHISEPLSVEPIKSPANMERVG